MDEKSTIEILVKIVFIIFCFVLSVFAVYGSIKGAYDDPILTSIQTIEVQKVKMLLSRSFAARKAF